MDLVIGDRRILLEQVGDITTEEIPVEPATFEAEDVCPECIGNDEDPMAGGEACWLCKGGGTVEWDTRIVMEREPDGSIRKPAEHLNARGRGDETPPLALLDREGRIDALLELGSQGVSPE